MGHWWSLHAPLIQVLAVQTLGLQRSERQRQMVHDFRELVGIELLPENLKHGTCHNQRICWKSLRQLRRNMLDELGDMAFPRRCSCRVSALVINAAHEDGKLRAQLDRDFGRQSITQCMLDRPQSIVRMMAVVELKLFLDSLQQDIRLVNGMVQSSDPVAVMIRSIGEEKELHCVH
jgi:hypothetical protein